MQQIRLQRDAVDEMTPSDNLKMQSTLAAERASHHQATISVSKKVNPMETDES